MPRLAHSEWDTQNGVCLKHNLPRIPCPACLHGEGDEDLEIVLSGMDVITMEFENIPLRDLAPKNLISRIDNNTIEIRHSGR